MCSLSLQAKQCKAAILMGPVLLLCTWQLLALAQPAVPEVDGEVDVANGTGLPTSALTDESSSTGLVTHPVGPPCAVAACQPATTAYLTTDLRTKVFEANTDALLHR